MKPLIPTLIFLLLCCSCSLVGIQNEEGPNYKVLVKEGSNEIREYDSYVVAETTVQGSYKDSSGKAFRILAGYIFGKNKKKQSIAMTSPVNMVNEDNDKEESTMIAMTSPVEMNQDNGSFTMKFSMPSKYKIVDLPEPLDKRVRFKVIPKKIVASHQFSWFWNQKKNAEKAKELREWLVQHPKYKPSTTHSFAGYNPPWTLPFFRRNEVHIELK